MYELDHRKDQVMTVCKAALANLAMWVRDHYFPASYAQATWKRLQVFFQLSGTITQDATLVQVELRPVESRYVVPSLLAESLIKSYLVAAIGSGSDAPARSMSGSNWRKYDWRLSMLRRGQTTTFQERLVITERAAAGQSDPEIAAALGCSVWTVRKWRRRGQRQGRTGLGSQMGRPTAGPLGTFPTGMREAIVRMRRTHPGWGPTTLLAVLRVDPRWADRPLPSRSRIAALLTTEKLTRRYQKHSDLPAPAIRPEGAPHDEWELDAQGRMHVAGLGNVSLVSILDVVSRFKVESYPCLDTTNPPFEAYQLQLRRAF